jgi:hypothetical protein
VSQQSPHLAIPLDPIVLTMSNSPTFLHLTDVHLATSGTKFSRDDHKVDIPDIQQDTREDVLELTLKRLAERLHSEKRVLDGVIWAGGRPRSSAQAPIEAFGRLWCIGKQHRRRSREP